MSDSPTTKPPRDDFFSRLAWRLTTPSEVAPRLGLRFAPTPDLPDENTARWRSQWQIEAQANKRATE